MHYFVYKSGTGNSWSQLAQLRGHLYVGYDGDWRPEGADADLTPIPVLDETGRLLRDDLGNILLVAHPDNRSRFTLLTFEKTVLRFWRVTDAVQRHTIGSDIWRHAEEIAKNQPAMRAYGQFRWDRAKLPGQGSGGRTYADLTDDERAFRTLPVELVGEVPRQRQYTSIDSLSVYQYLNRGTCRPLWRIGGPSGSTMPAGISPTDPTDTFPQGSRRQETPFGAFARLYLNDVWRDCARGSVAPPSGLRNVNDLDYGALVLATLNPILVETAALAFCQDLGLTPDIGVGKGMDVVDVRARAAGADGFFCEPTARTALARLEAAGVCPSEELLSALLKRGVLDVQCKAADRKGGGDGVLYFGYRDESHGIDEVLVPRLPSMLAGLGFSGSGSALRRFLGVQAAVLSGAWLRGTDPE